ncbi:TIGR03619 family F420-dependent LLM class oxidoreductase [Dermatobacter hominis]|uniref:TIGR03619 family F420-dependent LLM class oxidoreductase n=1 Tax=Dermatobacter hominis TaxID=2884263 RepID=UPI0035ABCBA9
MTLVTFSAEDPGGWSHALERAQLLDEVGVDRLVVSDHVAFGEDLEAYGRPELGGTAGGVQPTGPDGHWLEPLTTLAVVAGRTSTIRLGTNILIAALRRPAVLAKTAATLDVLSGGRLDLGVGVGWQREEYEAAGLDFGRRGRLLDESLEVLEALWTQQRARHSGPTLTFDGIHQMPKPVQPGGVPVWVSGRIGPRVVERLGRFGHGWIPWGDDAADPIAAAGRMRAALEQAGYDPAGLEVVGRLAIDGPDGLGVDGAMATVPELVAAGVTDLRASLRLPADADAARERLVEVVGAFRVATGRPPVAATVPGSAR